MKSILEVFENDRFFYEMPNEIFTLVQMAWKQAVAINSETTIGYIVLTMPDELRSRITTTRLSNMPMDSIEYVSEATIVYQWGKDFDL